jgi:hypothetical protein
MVPAFHDPTLISLECARLTQVTTLVFIVLGRQNPEVGDIMIQGYFVQDLFVRNHWFFYGDCLGHYDRGRLDLGHGIQKK